MLKYQKRMMIMNIITLTLNPAFDVHCSINELELYKENYASGILKHAGGKGVNISRALNSFGALNTAFCLLAESGGDEFLSGLSADGINCRYLMVKGRIRENITIHSPKGETRLSFEGFKIKKEILNDVFAQLVGDISENTVVTFTGRLCDGITNDDAIQFIMKIKETGEKVVVDCNSFSVNELFEIKPFLIKPNEQEISQMLGYDVKDENDALKAAEIFFAEGIENVMISLGAQGLVFKNESGAYKVTVPKITPLSTIGAGDSTIAGFIARLASGADITDILKSAAASGTAACLAEGTNPPEYEVISKIKEQISVEKI
jgi:1-phosphofructokinase family hexose kinase